MRDKTIQSAAIRRHSSSYFLEWSDTAHRLEKVDAESSHAVACRVGGLDHGPETKPDERAVSARLPP